MRKDVVFSMFKNKVKFVKPLYKKTRHIDKDETNILAVNFDSSVDLRGDGIYVNRNVNTESGLILSNDNKLRYNKSGNFTIPGVCEPSTGLSSNASITCLKFDNFNKKSNLKNNIYENNSKLDIPKNRRYNKMSEKESECDIGGGSKQIKANKQIVLHKVSDAWLRVYPAPRKLGEGVCSIIIRCVFCQLGLTAVLVIWNVIWVFVIHSFEGPQEVKVSLDFEKEQNQLVIDLATELRQITPLSSKWREAIEQRINDARQLTMLAVGNGAKLKPGLFWDLPGTFLFSIYVMTALGFGAPVPHTTWGRMSALIYAIIAVPTHIYLMWSASVFIVVTLEQCTLTFKKKYCISNNTKIKKPTLDSLKESSNTTENSDVEDKPIVRNSCIPVVFCLDHCISLSLALYYVLGVVVFGVLRDRTPLEIVMFPLEFTTTGGLENVNSHVRMLYGFYVEGAMCLLACALANVRRFSSSPVSSLLENYRLFHNADCTECGNNDQCKMTRVS